MTLTANWKPLKKIIHPRSGVVLASLPGAWIASNVILVIIGLPNTLGGQPVELVHAVLGRATLYALIATLAISLLAYIKERETGYGLKWAKRFVFLYFFLHAMAWAFLDVPLLFLMVIEVLRFDHLMIALASAAVLLPLFATNNNPSKRLIGDRAWGYLQALYYPLALLGAFHVIKGAPDAFVEGLICIILVAVIGLAHVATWLRRTIHQAKKNLPD